MKTVLQKQKKCFFFLNYQLISKTKKKKKFNRVQKSNVTNFACKNFNALFIVDSEVFRLKTYPMVNRILMPWIFCLTLTDQEYLKTNLEIAIETDYYI